MPEEQKKLPRIILLAGISLAVLFVATGVWYVFVRDSTEETEQQITNFAECAAAGNPIMESYPEQCAANGQTFVNDAAVVDDGWIEDVASAQGAYTVSFPGDWGDVISVQDSDWFIIPGQNQPQGTFQVVPSESYGSDSPSVFGILVHDNFAPAQGEAEDFTLVNGKENPIKGKKYTKIYQEDELVGIGIQRFAGDRDYEYVFSIGGKEELRVWYSVYGVDPRNMSVKVEAIIDSIRLK